MQDQVRALGDKTITKRVNKAAADVVLDQAGVNAPVRSGALRRSGRTSGTQRAGVVRYGSARVPYAAPIHFGHSNRPQGGFTLPNPYLYDAADQRRAEVYEKFREQVAKLPRSLPE